jgi:two-component system chemotaxis response regulator CheY
MDITMPVMNGVEALSEIKKRDPEACVVMISALGQEEWIREAIIKGAKTFIVKPYKEETVLETLRKI